MHLALLFVEIGNDGEDIVERQAALDGRYVVALPCGFGPVKPSP